MNFSPMRALVYRSSPTRTLSSDDLTRLALHAQSLNALDGISGLLIAGPDRYVQLIEGSEEGIEALLDRLRADDRHSGLTIVFDRTVARRSTMGWDMQLIAGGDALGRLDEAELALLDRLDADLRHAVFVAVSG